MLYFMGGKSPYNQQSTIHEFTTLTSWVEVESWKQDSNASSEELFVNFIAIQSYLKKQEKYKIDNLALHLKQL